MRTSHVRLLIVLLAARVGSPLTHAGPLEEGPTAQELAAQVVAWSEAGDTQALEEAAQRGEPDPWLVVDALVGREAVAQARHFAQLVPPEFGPLTQYAAEAAAAEPQREVRSALAAIEEELAAGRGVAARELYEGNALAPLARTVLECLTKEAQARTALFGPDARAAAPLHEEASRLARALGWHRKEAEALASAGQAAYFACDYEGSLRHFKALVLLERQRESGLALADAYRSLASAHAMLGDTPSAVATLRDECLPRYEAGDDAGSAVAVLSTLMDLQTASGGLVEAVRLRKEVQDAHAARPPPPSDRAEHENYLGLLDLALGDLEAALAHFRSAAAQYRVLKRPDAIGAGMALGNMAAAHAQCGRYEEAVREIDAALQAFESAPDEPEALRHIAAAVHGAAHYRLLGFVQRMRTARLSGMSAGDLERLRREQQREVLGRALARLNAGIARLTKGGVRPNLAAAWESRGRVYLHLDRFGEGVADFEECLREARTLGMPTLLLEAQTSLARAHALEARWRECLDGCLAAAATLEGMLTGLGDAYDARGLGDQADVFDLGLMAAARLVAAKDPRALEAAFEFLERGRASSMLEGLGGRAVVREAAAPSELAGRESLLDAQVKRLGEEVQRLVAARDPRPEVQAQLRQTKEELVETERELRQVQALIATAKLREQRLLRPQRPRLAQMQSRLDANEAYVAYALLPEEAWALVVTREGARLVALTETPKDVAAIQGALVTLGVNQESGQPALVGPDAEAALTLLRRHVLERLALPKGISRLLVAPDGGLAFLPWSLLLDGLPPTSDGTPWSVALLPSATVLKQLDDGVSSGGQGVLAIGDPDYTSPTSQGAMSLSDLIAKRSGRRLDPLQHAAAELEAVTPLPQVDRRLPGPAATKRRLWETLATKNRDERWRALYIVAHGLADIERPRYSCIALTPESGDMGMLTALEVAAGHVPADVVVLSACQTGKGAFVRAEGAIGLPRAFMLAGAPRVLVSLWDVDDRATMELMRLFNDFLNAGDGAALALSKAQRTLRQTHPNPLHWAAWVLWGLPNGPGPDPARVSAAKGK